MQAHSHTIGRRLAAIAGGVCALGALMAGSVAQGAVTARRHHGGGGSKHGYVSGRVNLPGYTVLVVGYNGRVASSRARSFRIVAPDSRVTLQLVNSHGVYAGPVTLGGSATKAIVGLRAPAQVGTIDVVSARGYGHLAGRLAAKLLDGSRWAHARHGVPLGNGLNLGLVSVRGGHGGRGPGADAAQIGIPNELDVAIPGTRTLRALAPASLALRASAAASGGVAFAASLGGTAFAAGSEEKPAPAAGPGTPPAPGSPAGTAPPPGPSSSSPWMSQLFLAINESLNDDAAGVTVAQIDATLQSKLNLKLLGVPSTASLLELECNGLSFCSPGGSGQAELEGQGASSQGAFATTPFPGGSADPASGLGELVGPNAAPGILGNFAGGGREFSLDPHATSAQIGSGDVIDELLGEGASATKIPTTIDFVFNTVPAIASYSDGAGDSGTILYPDTSNLGTPNNPLKVAAGSGGDVVVTFTVFKPQRQGIAGAGEPAFMDVGHLAYELDYAAPVTPGSGAVGSTTAPQCPAASYANPSSTLSLVSGGSGEHAPPPGDGAMVDSAEDQPASASDTISFSVDLTQCLAAKGVSSFPVGQPVTFDLSANSQSSSDHANQTFSVERTR